LQKLWSKSKEGKAGTVIPAATFSLDIFTVPVHLCDHLVQRSYNWMVA